MFFIKQILAGLDWIRHLNIDHIARQKKKKPELSKFLKNVITFYFILLYYKKIY